MTSVSTKTIAGVSANKPEPGPSPKRAPSLYIRYYRQTDDLNRMRNMFFQSNMCGPNAPYVIGLSRFAIHTIGAYGLFAVSLMCLIVTSTKPRCIPVLPVLGIDEKSPFVLWVPVVTTAVSIVAIIYFWYYRRKIRYVFRVYIDDGLEKDFRDIMGIFGLESRVGSLDSFPSGSSGFWVAQEGGEIVGFVGLDANMSEKEAAEVRRLVVSPSRHRRGVATKLMDVVEEHARANGIIALELTTSNYNLGALSLYEKRGWRRKAKVRYAGIFLNALRKDL